MSENVENVDESSTTAASTTTSSTSSAVPSTTQEQLIEIESETSPHTQSMTSTLSPPSIDLDSDTLTTTEIPSTSSTTTTTVVSIVVESITSAEDLDKVEIRYRISLSFFNLSNLPTFSVFPHIYQSLISKFN